MTITREILDRGGHHKVIPKDDGYASEIPRSRWWLHGKPTDDEQICYSIDGVFTLAPVFMPVEDAIRDFVLKDESTP